MNDQITLGRMIEILDSYDPARATVLSFSFGSYRGSYDQLAAGLSPKFSKHSIADLRNNLPLGRTFPGYKGGEFCMNSGTFVWLAGYGSPGIPMTEAILRALIEAEPSSNTA
jgi:hypothetical protein